MSALFVSLAVVTTTSAAAAPSSQQFAIAYGTVVSDGVPVVGAGNLEVGGATDVYVFDATAGDAVIFDVLAGGAGVFRWSLESPSGGVLRDSALFTDFVVDAAESGTYIVSVSGATAATTGTYSFGLRRVPSPERFSIGFGETVSEGIPGPGAGNVEVPGAQDRYAFDGVAGQAIVFDHLAGRNVFIGWTLTGPDGATLFSSFIGDRQLVLPVTGTYELTLRGNGVGDTGTYSFVVLLAPGSEVFPISIGDTVSEGVPGTGAGNLEGPGSTDVYTFVGHASQGVSIDHLTGSNVALGWRLIAPDGAEIFDSFLADRDVVLPATGSYSLVVRGNGPADFGGYSFRISESPVNRPPIIEPLFDLENAEGDAVDIEVVGGDPDGDLLDLTATGLPPGVVVDPTRRVLSGLIAAGAAAGSPYDVTVTVTDPAGASAATTITWTVTAPPIPTTTTTTVPPTTTTLPPTTTVPPTTTTLPPTTTTAVPPTTTTVPPTTSTTTTTTPSTTTTTTVPPSDSIAARVDVVPPARCIRADRAGWVVVIVYGSVDLDVGRIDRRSVRLESMPAAARRPFALRWDVDHDGYADLVIVVTTTAGGIDDDATAVTVSGRLDDGATFAGNDDVCVVSGWCGWRLDPRLFDGSRR